MNGLEAIELMKQGKKVSIVDAAGFYQIKDGRIWLTYPTSKVMWEVLFFDLSNTYCEYIEPKALTGWERNEHWEDSEGFYTIVACDAFADRTSYNHVLNEKCYKNANYFSTKEKAEEINFKQTLLRKLQRFSDENGGNEIDWNNEIKMKWGIWYNNEYEELASCPYVYGQAFGQVYFISEEVAEKAIELFCDELIEYFTHDWSGKNEASTVVNSKER